jgi:V8-like Glu-specific endopeptidase
MNMKSQLLVLLLGAFVLSTLAMPKPGPHQIGEHIPVRISSVDTESDIPAVLVSGTTKSSLKTWTLVHEDASYIALHFAKLDLDPGCTIEISDGDGVQRILMKAKGKHNLGKFWANLVVGDSAVISVLCKEKSLKADFEIDDYVAGYPDAFDDAADVVTKDVVTKKKKKAKKTEKDKTGNGDKTDNGASTPEGEKKNKKKKKGKKNKRNLRGVPFLDEDEIDERELSICGDIDFRDAHCYETGEFSTEYSKSRAIAKVIIQGSGVCTGWLVGENNVLITNEHCIGSEDDAMNAQYLFDLENKSAEKDCNAHNGAQGFLPADNYEAMEFLALDVTNDWALVRLKGNPIGKYGYLDLDNRVPEVDEEIYIPQHPGGGDKVIAIYDDNYGTNSRCQVKSTTSGSCYGKSRTLYDDIRYSCDTQGGSSGSPVINAATHTVVALHHCGGACNGNYGVPIYAIYDQLAAYVYGITQAPTAAPPSESPTYDNCPDDMYAWKLELKTDSYPRETSWDLKDSSGNVLRSGGDYTSIANVYTYKYCLEPGVHTFTIYDAFGDGICCDYLVGYYKMWYNGVLLKDNGNIGKEESTTFGSDGNPAPILSTPTPTVATPVPTASTSAPTKSTPTPTVSTAAPTKSTPAPTVATPVPTVSTPVPTKSTPEPTMESGHPTATPTPAPTESTPGPTEATSAPTESTPGPTEATPAPTESTPAPTASTPGPTAATPAPSAGPTGAPTATCGQGEYEFRLEIKLDHYAGETFWEVEDTSGNIVLEEGDGYGNNDLIFESHCLENGKGYKFVITDKYQDGFCCNYGQGYYKIWYNNELVASELGDIGAERSHMFGLVP